MSDFEDRVILPENFPDLRCRGKPFIWLFENRKEFVNFCVDEMKEPSGLFKILQDYFCRKIKNETVP